MEWEHNRKMGNGTGLLEVHAANDLAHPKLYEFIEIIQREQAATEVTIQQLDGGGWLQAKAVQHEGNIKDSLMISCQEIEL